MKFARIEREQRWLCRSVPRETVDSIHISDRYIEGTRLRLRILRRDGVGAEYKLTQKLSMDEAGDAARVTTIYLAEREHALLASLPARTISKTRRYVRHEGKMVAVDELHDRHQGIVLAEIELGVGEAYLPTPGWADRDITGDKRFSGGALASADDEAITVLWSEIAAALAAVDND